ncbi:MAG TPA: hypothetical protein VEK56_02810 [Vicinamibacterales bacterium]|nr:hypothetical protein [Vicinamibacterales bacterium]
MTPLPYGLLVLLVLAMPIASLSWSVTHEDIFKEARESLVRRSEKANLLTRKLTYLFLCEYCFSHWVTLGVVMVTGFRLLYDDWRGYAISGLSLVWIANHYMSLFGRLRLGIRSERIDVSLKEELRDQVVEENERKPQRQFRSSARH